MPASDDLPFDVSRGKRWSRGRVRARPRRKPSVEIRLVVRIALVKPAKLN
jgi:hypothetical protein